MGIPIPIGDQNPKDPPPLQPACSNGNSLSWPPESRYQLLLMVGIFYPIGTWSQICSLVTTERYCRIGMQMMPRVKFWHNCCCLT